MVRSADRSADGRAVLRWRTPASCAALLVFPLLGLSPVHSPEGCALPRGPQASAAGPEYYEFPLVSTRRVPGTGRAEAVAEVAFPSSPYGVSLAPDGSYRYDVRLRISRLKQPRDGTFVLWAATPSLDEIRPLGRLGSGSVFSGQVAWNKFLLVVTWESVFDPDAAKWSGPIVMRGISRSGLMHTMAGHGPFEREKCAAYGY